MKAKILSIEIEFNKNSIKNLLEFNIANNKKGTINTINANILVHAYKNTKYRALLKKSVLNICDGAVLSSSLNFINKTKYEPYPGPDFFIDRIKEKKYKHAFLGSTHTVLDSLKKELQKIDNNIEQALFIELPFLMVDEFEYKEIGKKINNFNPDFIWVSLGAPKQEEFSFNILKHIDGGMVVSVGAAFDFYSGLNHVKRCPNILQKLKLEWLYRLFKQPKKTANRLLREIFYLPIILFNEFFKKR